MQIESSAPAHIPRAVEATCRTYHLTPYHQSDVGYAKFVHYEYFPPSAEELRMMKRQQRAVREMEAASAATQREHKKPRAKCANCDSDRHHQRRCTFLNRRCNKDGRRTYYECSCRPKCTPDLSRKPRAGGR